MGALVRGHLPDCAHRVRHNTMRWITILRLRLRSLFSRGKVEQDLEEELHYHLERQIDEEIAKGRTPEEARYAALRSIANLEQRKEQCRDTRGINLLSNLQQDLGYALRQLRKNPGFAITAVLVLAAGTCASTAIFAIADATLLQPLPYRNPGRLVGVYERVALFAQSNLSYLDYLDWKKLNNVFTALEVYRNNGAILTTPAGAQPVHTARVSAGFFRVLGVTPALGRDFHAGEERPKAPGTVMLSYAAWQKRYGGSPNILGRTLVIGGAPYTVIGILPKNFHFAPVEPAEFWTTLDISADCERNRSCHNLFGVARLKDGVSIQAALADTKLIASRLEQQYPDSNRGQSANVIPLTEVIVGDIRPIILVLLSGAGLLLLIAYTNTASLLLVRSESRRREIAVRRALGAGNTRLMQQFVTEGLFLVAASTGIGLLLAYSAVHSLPKLLLPGMLAHMPYLQHLGLNRHVLIFVGSVVLIGVLLFAITPVIHLSRSDLRSGITEGSRGSAGNTWRRTGSKLVVLELATAMILLVGAGLLGKSLYHLLHVHLGIEPDHLATAFIAAPRNRYPSQQQQIALARDVLRRTEALPGVKSAGISTVLPVSFNGNTDWIRVVGHPYNGEHNEVNERDVSSDYFRTLEAKLLRGRYFTDAEDLSKSKVVIINQAFAQKYFPGEDPIGKQIGGITLSPDSLRTIIGIVENIREGSLDSEIWPAEYLPFNQDPDTEFALVVRTSQSAQSLLPAMHVLIHGIDPGIVTLDGIDMRQRIDNSASAYLHRSAAWLVSSFAVIALLLGVIGLYGVVAYSVGQRTREIGIRMALGAQSGSVHWLILREAALLALTGTLIGMAGSFAAATLLRRLLFGVHSWDLPTLAGVTVVLVGSALLASYLPARRAASVDPVEALRAE